MYLAFHKMILTMFPSLKNNNFFRSRIGTILSIVITQYLVFLAWIAFRVRDTEGMLYSMSKYILVDFHTAKTVHVILSHKFPIVIVLIFVGLYLISYKKENFVEKIAKLQLRYWMSFLIGMMLLVMVFFDGRPEKFIYFQF